MKALCQEYRNGARRNEQRNGENDTYRFQRRHNGQRDHAQQPIMQPSRMQTAYLRLLIIKAEQQKIPPFYANNKCNQPGNNHRLDYIADGYPEHVAEKNMAPHQPHCVGIIAGIPQFDRICTLFNAFRRLNYGTD